MLQKSFLRDPRLVATAIVVVGGLATFAVNFPGVMEFDSFVQLLEGRTKSYGYWHPPVMSWLLGEFDQLPGFVATWFMAMDMVLAFGALLVLLWLPRRVSPAAAAAVALMLFLPSLALTQAVVWKDALFADAALAGAMAIALAVNRWAVPAVRWPALVVGSLLVALAVLTRQNGVVILPCLVAGLAWAVRRQTGRWRLGVAYGGGMLIVTIAWVMAANAALLVYWDGTPSTQYQFNVLRLYDIVGMVKREPSLPLAVFDRAAPQLAHRIRTETVTLWTPAKSDTMETPPVVVAIEAVPAEAYKQQWLALVTAHPGLYLKVRGEIFRWVFQPPDVRLCHPFIVGIQPGAEPVDDFVIVPRMDPHDIALKHYGDFLANHTPLFSHGLFALIGAGVMVIVLRRRAPADIMVASLIAASFVFTATFLIISIACDYRYLTIVDLSAIAGLLYVIADWRSLRR
jgi:hypothetical protein